MFSGRGSTHNTAWWGPLTSTTVPGNVKVNGTNHYSGPWYEVQPDMSNPYTNHNPVDPFRVYRLRKVNHGSP